MELIQVFGNVILPVFAMAAAGAVVHKLRPISPEPLSRTILLIFSPALVFYGLATTPVAMRDLGLIAVFSLLLLAIMFVLAHVAIRLLRVEQEARSTFVLASLFMNAGNFGLPVALFAFGDSGFGIAVVFFVIWAILGWTVGVFIVSQSQSSPMVALRTVLALPTGYAAVAGLAVTGFSLDLPEVVLRFTDILGNAAIPAMLIVLGVQIMSTKGLTDLRAIVGPVVLRLVVAAAIAYGLAQLLGMDEITTKVLVIMAAMPTAVFTTILATEYKGRPELASSIVVVGTLTSLLTVTVLLTIIGIG